jgi:hypothetical protein
MTKPRSIILWVWLTALAAGVSPAVARAQDATHFVYFAPGNEVGRASSSQTYAAGIGLERALERHLAVQVDIAAASYFDANDGRRVSGLASFDAVFRALPERKVQLFGVAGYSLRFRDDTTNMFNYGVGLHHWFREDRGLLVEIRDHTATKDQATLRHFWHVRIGLVFR